MTRRKPERECMNNNYSFDWIGPVVLTLIVYGVIAGVLSNIL